MEDIVDNGYNLLSKMYLSTQRKNNHNSIEYARLKHNLDKKMNAIYRNRQQVIDQGCHHI